MALDLTYEDVIVYAARDEEEADHFFGHLLGLTLAGAEGALRFYALDDRSAVAVDVSGAIDELPYLLFSSSDLTAAAEHFLERGCSVRELPWASGGGFLARSPEGRTVCVIAREQEPATQENS